MARIRKLLSIIVILCICTTFVPEQKVVAVNNMIYKLKEERSYKSYDVTGDKIKDTVRVTVTENKKHEFDYSETMRIHINNSIVFKSTADNVIMWNVGLIFIDNKVLFDISNLVESEDVGFHELFQLKNGKLKSIYDLQENTSMGYARNHSIRLTKVLGNTITGTVFTQFLTTGGFLTFDLNIKYEDGKFSIPPINHPIKYEEKKYNKWTVNRKINIYKKAGSNEIAYTLRKGDKIKINSVLYKDDKIYFKVKNKKGKGEPGYLPATKEYLYPSTYYFKDTFYSG